MPLHAIFIQPDDSAIGHATTKPGDQEAVDTSEEDSNG